MSKEQREDRWYELRDIDVDAAFKRMRILAVPYGTWTNLGGMHERIDAHAPDKSIKEAARGLPLLLFHDNASFPIGRSARWTLDDPAALIGDWAIDSDDRSQEAARKARDGFLNGASIGFLPIRSGRVWNDEDGWDDSVSREESYLQVTRHEIRLLEVSLTPTPAFAGAEVQLVRSLHRSEPLPAGKSKPRMDARSRVMIDDFRAMAAGVRDR